MVNVGFNYKDKVSQLISWGHWFSFFNIFFALIISSRYLVHADWPKTVIGQIYLLISWLGHFSFLIFIFYLLILFPLSFLISKQKALRFIGAIFATTGLSILAIDTQIFSEFHQHLNPHFFNLITDSGQNDQAQSWHLFYILIPLLFIIELVISNFIWRKRKRLNRYRLGSASAVFFLACFLLTHLIYIWADAAVYRPIITQKINYPLSYPMTAKSFLIEHGLLNDNFNDPSTPYFPKLTEPKQGKQFKYPLRAIEFKANKQPLNVLIVVVDALRFDMLNNRNMPNLWQFSQHSLNFKQHHSGSNNSLDGIYSLFYGLPSNYRHRVIENNISPVLMQTFARQQYRIYQSDANPSAKNNHALSNPLVSQLRSASPEYKTAKDDLSTLQNWQTWLTAQTKSSESKPSPWFSYIRLRAPANYQAPAEFQSPFNTQLNDVSQLLQKGGDKKGLIPNYQHAVYFADTLLAQTINTLKQNKQLANTVVIITSGSGQEFNDSMQNHWGNNSNFSKYQSQVPLVIHWPGQQTKQITQDSSHLDIVPTLMTELLGVITQASEYSSGTNLFKPHFKKGLRGWILISDADHYAIYQKNKIMQFNQQGDYQLLDRNYLPLPTKHYNLQNLLQALTELERFYPEK